MKIKKCINGVITEEEYTPTEEEIKQQKLAEIQALKDFLSATDYKVIKAIEQGLDGDFTDRQNARNRINELEEEIKG